MQTSEPVERATPAKHAIGRMMTAADAVKLTERLDPIPKRPPAPSVRRSGKRPIRIRR